MRKKYEMLPVEELKDILLVRKDSKLYKKTKKEQMKKFYFFRYGNMPPARFKIREWYNIKFSKADNLSLDNNLWIKLFLFLYFYKEGIITNKEIEN